MNRWKFAFFSALAVLVLSNIYWAFEFVDAAVSYSYLHDSYDEESRKVERLGDLIVQGSTEYSKADFLHLLRQANPDALIAQEEDKILISGITFTFTEDRLSEVE